MKTPQSRPLYRWLWWGIATIVIIIVIIAGLHVLSGLDLSRLQEGKRQATPS